ncbi:hypothetical protein J6590_093490, partial [Homalodisca vitripennis]
YEPIESPKFFPICCTVPNMLVANDLWLVNANIPIFCLESRQKKMNPGVVNAQDAIHEHDILRKEEENKGHAKRRDRSPLSLILSVLMGHWPVRGSYQTK